jgi:hypothetical protein
MSVTGLYSYISMDECFLQCAMEENCLGTEAYRIRKEDPNFAMATRRLLRYTLKSLADIFAWPRRLADYKTCK